MPSKIPGNTLVLSIKPKWIDAISAGEKRFELRRRPPRIEGHAQAILYATLPRGQLSLLCLAGPIITAPKAELWQRVSDTSGVSREEYDGYFESTDLASAIVLSEVRTIAPPIPLATLKQKANFNPPQSWCWAPPRLLNLLGALT